MGSLCAGGGARWGCRSLGERRWWGRSRWQPSVGGDLQTATVLYNGPTEKEKLFSADYDPDKLKMEYQDIDFAGLKLAVDTDPDAEKIIITLSGVDYNFKVKSVARKWDGKTFEAYLKIIDVG